MIDVSNFVKDCDGLPVAIFGLGVSGQSVVRACVAAGARVVAWDDREDARRQAQKAGAYIEQLDARVLKNAACLVLSPGVPLHFPQPHDVVKNARAVNLEIISDIEILHRCDHGRRVIGVTGTNGKSTTVALIDHVLRSCGNSVACGGNIGRAVLDLDMPTADGVFVLELSSYQLDLCPTFTPDIAVLLNITPDHLDRHGSMDGYIAAKAQMLVGAQCVIVATDDEHTRALAKTVQSDALIAVSKEDDLKIDTQIQTLRGAHNYQNMAAAMVTALQVGCMRDDIIAAFKTYAGLPHRQFLVREIDGVLYVNDSKATNAHAASKALSSYDNIYWIVGGEAKNGGLDGLEGLMSRVKQAFVIGQASDRFMAWLEKNNVECSAAQTLDKAVMLAHEAAHSGVVLLSPACASWDQFKSFEDRGNQFSALVHALEGGL